MLRRTFLKQIGVALGVSQIPLGMPDAAVEPLKWPNEQEHAKTRECLERLREHIFEYNRDVFEELHRDAMLYGSPRYYIKKNCEIVRIPPNEWKPD